MKISELINLQLIHLEMQAKSKDQAILELCKILKSENRVSDLELFIDDVFEREALGSTGIGFQIAIPHTKSKYVTKPSLIFGRSNHTVEFESLDNEPVKLFFLIAMPEEGTYSHLQVLALLSRNLIHEEFRDQLLDAKTAEEVLSILKTIDKA